MLDVEQILECKQLAGQGVPIREISRRLALSRNAVRRYLRGAEPGAYRMKRPRAQPIREQITGRVRALLEAERAADAPRKQRLSAARIHRVLASEGLQACERAVRQVVAAIRIELRDPLQHAFVPLQYDPGEDAQVDFMEGEVDDQHEGRVKRDVLIVRLCYSREAFRYAAPNQTREALFEGLMQAFESFGGVPRNVWFDNLTPAVRRVLKGRDRELQRSFEAFQAHYGFRAQFCAPAKGNEKGGVERDVNCTRREVFTPIPRVAGREGLQQLLDQHGIAEAKRKVRGCDRSIGELAAFEREALLPLPPVRFEAATTRTLRVSKSSWIQLGTNFYSVPVHLAGCHVTVKTHAEHVVAIHAGDEVARHRRCYGHGRMVLVLEHYLPLLLRKHRALDRAVPMRQWFDQVPACWRQLLGVLREQLGEIDGSKSFLEIVRLCGQRGTDAVTAAVEKTLAGASASLAVVRYHLGMQVEGERPPMSLLTYDGPSVQQGPISAYAGVVNG